MSSQTADIPSTASSSAAGTQGFSRPNPVCTEIGVSVQGSAHAAGGSASQPFLEQTSTVIVFAQGAVVRLSETVVPGQILILRHLQTNEEAACRVVSVKTNPNVKGYVELEFLQPAPHFWGMEFPAPTSVKTPSAPAAHREPPPPSLQAESNASPNREIPQPAALKDVSPAAAPRYVAPPSEEANGATGPGLTFLPDLLETLALPGEAKQRAQEAAARPETPHPAPIRAERVASPESADRVASTDIAPAKPLVAPWIAAPATRMDTAKSAHPAGDGKYVSDLLDTLTPIGETILREKPKSAASQPQSHAAPNAPTVARSTAVIFAEPSSAEIALPSLPAESAHVAPRASAQASVPNVGPEVAPLLSSGAEAFSRGDLLNGDFAPAKSSQGWPTPMRVLAVVAAVALAMAAGAGIYRWEKRPGPDASLATSSQPASTGAAPSASTAEPSGSQPASDAAPVSAASSSSAAVATAKDSRSAAQPSASSNAIAPAAKTPAVAHSAVVVTAPRGPVVAAMKISAPSAATQHANQAAPSIAASGPGAVENAAAGGILGYAQPNGPASPIPLRTSSGAQQPRLLSATAPSYPYAARAEHVQGDVSVDMLIDQFGKVASMTVLSGPTLLRQTALDALGRRKYAPAMLDGRPTTAHIVVVVHFQL
jgi:hypothetical protein